MASVNLHFHELTTRAKSAHVKNLHVEAHVQPRKGADGRQENDITLLYKVSEGEKARAPSVLSELMALFAIGICDQSFGIQSGIIIHGTHGKMHPPAVQPVSHACMHLQCCKSAKL